MTTAESQGPEHNAKLYQIFCFAGAYNLSYAYVIKDGDSPMSLVSFAEPEFDVEYVKGDDTDTKLKRPPRVTGYSATFFLVNADFDEKTMTLTDNGKWRGIGDAWSSGSWTLKDGQFVLSQYSIDPIYEANLDPAPAGLEDRYFQLYPKFRAK